MRASWCDVMRCSALGEDATTDTACFHGNTAVIISRVLAFYCVYVVMVTRMLPSNRDDIICFIATRSEFGIAGWHEGITVYRVFLHVTGVRQSL